MTQNFSIILRISPLKKGAGAKIVGKLNEGNNWYVSECLEGKISKNSVKGLRGDYDDDEPGLLENITSIQSDKIVAETDMRDMFQGCHSLTNIDGLASWDVSSVMVDYAILKNAPIELQNPNILMPNCLMSKVPKLYETDGQNLTDKVVHTAFRIPFCRWTWYMAEYDPETKDAFGFVDGPVPEWGYFNLKELEDLGAQRLTLVNFPKPFRELKDIGLVNQMTPEEISSVFYGELDKDLEHDEPDGMEI